MASPANGTWYTLALASGAVVIFNDLHILSIQINSMTDATQPAWLMLDDQPNSIEITQPQALKLVGGSFPPELL